ncbi:MAG: ACP S-malonyltransferase [Alphaproteobacteria bacterium]|nr:MAG: ACP S-malonyltransferase [Alphaproteobacteria bacterium]
MANVIAAPISDPEEIKQRLVEQVTGMVRWTECVTWLVKDGGVTQLVELGSGKVLAGLAKRIVPETPAVSIGTPADVDAFLATLN